MRRERSRKRERGFTLIELLAAMGIFLIVCGAAFTLLNTSQQRYQTESQVLNSFQEARLGLDQIVRDVNDAGYPPPTFFSSAAPANSAISPFAWSPGYPTPGKPSGSACAIGSGVGSCTTPGDFDLIIETNPNPLDGPTVQWIRYQLQGTILMRGVAPKMWGDDPATDTAAKLVPFVQNVANSPAQPIFSYTCDTTTAPQPVPCPSLGADNSPTNIRDVMITLIVAAPQPDATTGQQRLVVLNGRGRRINPNQ